MDDNFAMLALKDLVSERNKILAFSWQQGRYKVSLGRKHSVAHLVTEFPFQ